LKLSYSDLAEHLEGRLEPVYVLSGDQDLLRELAGKKLQQAVTGEEPTPFNLERFDFEQTSADQVLMTANMLPLLGGRRCVYVKRATRFVDGEDSLLRYVSDPCPSTVLVLDLEKKPDGRKKNWKELEKHAAVVICDQPKSWELEEWVADEARARGLKLGRDDVRYLVTELSSDLRRLLNEIEKLSLYAGADRLDLETIAEVLGRGKAQSVFKFIDALTAKDAQSALRQLGRLLDEGDAPLRILALLDRRVGQLRVAHDVRGSGRRENLASLLGVPPPAARAIAESARNLSEEWLRDAVAAVARTDRILKSSRLPDRVVLETLVIALARKAGKPQVPLAPARRASRDL
jgi:DNA polymerase-3 subunit delta